MQGIFYILLSINYGCLESVGNKSPFLYSGFIINRKYASFFKPFARIEFIGFHYVLHAKNGLVVENGLFDFYETLAKAMSTANLNLNIITKARDELKSIRFINVKKKVLRMPIGE